MVVPALTLLRNGGQPTYQVKVLKRIPEPPPALITVGLPPRQRASAVHDGRLTRKLARGVPADSDTQFCNFKAPIRRLHET
jgi:hypothetical protein